MGHSLCGICNCEPCECKTRPAVITKFSGEKVAEYLRLFGALPGEFDDAEVIASARRIITLIDRGYVNDDEKTRRVKSSTLYRVLTAFLAVAEM